MGGSAMAVRWNPAQGLLLFQCRARQMLRDVQIRDSHNEPRLRGLRLPEARFSSGGATTVVASAVNDTP